MRSLVDFRSDRLKALLVFASITLLTIVYYFLNNSYDAWSIDASTSWFVALLVYYFFSQPIYDGFLVLFTWYVYQQDREILSAFRGFAAAVLVMISLDLLSVPHSLPSLFQSTQALALPVDPNLAPYADYQIARYLAGISPQGLFNFADDLWLYIILPIILDLIALAIAKPAVYIKAVEAA